MTRGFDELTLTFYETKLCDYDKDYNIKYIREGFKKVIFITFIYSVSLHTPPPFLRVPAAYPPCVVWLILHGAADIANGAADMACDVADSFQFILIEIFKIFS